MKPDQQRDMRQVIAENLRKARKCKGLSQTELSASAKVGIGTIRNIERGVGNPRYSTLDTIAKILGAPVSDLMQDRNKLRNVRFRAAVEKPSRRRMYSRDRVLSEISVKMDQYQYMESIIAEFNKKARNAPIKMREYIFEPICESKKGKARDLEKAKAKAVAARELLVKNGVLKASAVKKGVNVDPVRDICGLLESAGIRLLLTSLASSDWYGLSVAADKYWKRPAIVVNDWERITTERKIFSAAHELGHLLMHLGSYNVEYESDDPDEEAEAHCFASHFLMPKETFESEWEDAEGHSFAQTVWKVKHIFGVSYQVVLWRLLNEYGVKDAFDKYKDSCNKHGYRVKGVLNKMEHYPLPEKAFMTDRLAKMIRVALENDLVSPSRAAEVAGLTLEHMRQIQSTWIQRNLDRRVCP